MVDFSEYSDTELINYIYNGFKDTTFSIPNSYYKQVVFNTLQRINHYNECTDVMDYYDVKGLNGAYIKAFRNIKTLMNTNQLQALKQLEENNE